MFATQPLRRPLIPAALAVAGTLIALACAPAAFAQEPVENPNNMSCNGFIKKGEADPDNPDEGVVAYQVGCSGKITGYALFSTHAVVGMETEVFAVDAANKEVVGTDLFACGGDVPGFGVNCTGSTSWGWRLMNGTFSISGDVCAEPRPRVVMYGVSATVASGKVTQTISGPWDLGRPRGCPKSSGGGGNLFPKEIEAGSRLQPVSAQSTPVKKQAKKVVKAKKAKKAKQAARTR